MTSSDLYILALPVVGFGLAVLGAALVLRVALGQLDKRHAAKREHKEGRRFVRYQD
jgi:hypothetical protein